MKIGVVGPFSWSYRGTVVEHVELQTEALEARGHEVRLVMGNDPPGQFTRALHLRVGRDGELPANMIPMLLRAWPEIHRRTGARLQICGADSRAVRLLFSRLRVSERGIDILGFLSRAELTDLISRTMALVAPALGRESVAMVLARAFGNASPAVASDILDYREVTTFETVFSVVPDDPGALTEAVAALLVDESNRVAMVAAARELALDRYAWSDIARILEGIYERVTAREHGRAA